MEIDLRAEQPDLTFGFLLVLLEELNGFEVPGEIDLRVTEAQWHSLMSDPEALFKHAANEYITQMVMAIPSGVLTIHKPESL